MLTSSHKSKPHDANVSFKIEDQSVYLNYTEIWNNDYDDDKHIKTKVKTFNNMINTPFLGDEIPKERIHHVCIATICTDSVLGVQKKNYPQVYLEQCKYKTKKVALSLELTDIFFLYALTFLCSFFL